MLLNMVNRLTEPQCKEISQAILEVADKITAAEEKAGMYEVKQVETQ